MMNSFRRSNSAPKLITATLLVLLFFAVDHISRGRLHEELRGILAPVSGLAERARTTLVESSWWSSRAALLNENALLRAEIARMKERDAQFDTIMIENGRLRAIALVASHEQGLTAPILTSLSASPYGTFVIGAGAAAGVAQNATVLSEHGFALGTVTDLASRSATVREVFSPGLMLDAQIGKVGFSLEGRGGGNARARIPREAQVKIGDTVTAPMFAGRPVGVVGSVQTASSSAYTDLYVQFPVNLNELRFVYVLTI